MKWKTRTRTLQRLIENWTLTTVVAYQLMKAKIKACIQTESTREKWLCKCIIILGTFLCRRSQNNRELKKPRRRRRGQRRLKNELIFYPYESRGTLKSFTMFISVKYITKLNLGHIDISEIKIQKISRRGSRSPDNTELGHFTFSFCWGRQRNVQRIITHVHSYCSAH